MSGDGPTIALAIICHQRLGELAEALASAEPAGAEELLVLDMATEPPLDVPPGVRLLRSDTNRGAAWGRNELARNTSCDVIFFLDDDAVLMPGALEVVRQTYREHPALGAVACRIHRPGGECLPHEQPFRKGMTAPDRPTPCAYFIGAAMAVRLEAFRAVGGSDERLTWGLEDIELAFRLQHGGFELLYQPAASVEHRPSARGRLAAPTVAGYYVHHHARLARTYLPPAIAVIHITVWAIYTLRDARATRGVQHWWRSLGQGLRIPVATRRLSLRQMLTIHRLGGRIFF